jgi:hypothetical protein
MQKRKRKSSDVEVKKDSGDEFESPKKNVKVFTTH